MRSTEYEDMRDQIVTAAGLVFAKYGYRKTTIEDIASSVHKAKSSVYHYFSGKDDIFRAVVEKEALQLMLSVRGAINAEASPVMKFRTFFRSMSEKIEEMVNYYRFVKDEWYDILDFANEVRMKYWKLIEGILVSILIEGNDQGVFAVDDPERTANAIQVAMIGFLSPWSSFKWEEVENCIDPLLDVMLFGIMKRKDVNEA